jgi:predicted metal-binding membrane protein
VVLMDRASESTVAEAPADLARESAFLATCAALFLASAGGTAYWCGSMDGDDMPMPGGWIMSMAWMKMPGQTWLGAAVSFIGMWILMMAAMMLPALAPMLLKYRRSIREFDETRLGWLTALAGAGYFFVWAIIGIAVYPLGVGLAAAEMQWSALARCVPIATGVVLLLVGCVQFTAWKARQLKCCRDAPCYARSLPPDARGAWRHGIHLGLHCSRCCAGFMIVLLMAGVMDLAAMAIVTVAIAFERLAPLPERAARIAGFVIAAAGFFVIAQAMRAA